MTTKKQVAVKVTVAGTVCDGRGGYFAAGHDISALDVDVVHALKARGYAK